MGRKKSKLKSVCCNAEIKINDAGLFCTKCHNPCDYVVKIRKTWTINPSTKVKKDERKKFQDKLTKEQIENYRKNEDF